MLENIGCSLEVETNVLNIARHEMHVGEHLLDACYILLETKLICAKT